MEIKKYVLTKDNKILEIHDKSTRGYSYVDYEKEGIIFTRTILEQDITKTSDYILELVELEDIIVIDTTFKGGYVKTFYIDKIEKGYEYIKFNNAFTIGLNDTLYTIFKKQPNGDYKRYEV